VDRFPFGVLQTGAWLNAVPSKPGFYAVALTVMAEPINLFLVFSDIRDKDVAWLLVVPCSKTS
jgi:hypothetical protein